MFEALEKFPHIHCEAFDLLRLPPLSLDPVAEQVQCNSQTLKSLASVIEKLENKLSSFIDSPKQQSYATMVTSVPLTQPSAPAQQSQSQASLPAQRTSSRSPLADGRECDGILFGLPEKQTIVVAKRVVDWKTGSNQRHPSSKVTSLSFFSSLSSFDQAMHCLGS